MFERLMLMRQVLAACWLGVLGISSLAAQPLPDHSLPSLLQSVGVAPAEMAPDPPRLAASPTRAQQLPLYQAVMANPQKAAYRAGMLASAFKSAADSPHALFGLVGAMAGLRLYRSPEAALSALEAKLRTTPDPLAASLAWMRPMAPTGETWPPKLPDVQQLPDPLRFELAMVLASMDQSHKFLQRALAKMPATLTPALLQRQALDGELQLFEEPDYRVLLPLIEREALLAGMLDLLAATERLSRFVKSSSPMPSVAWTLDTPLGQVVVDTTGRNNTHTLQDPLLVLDVGGDDHYAFLPQRKVHTVRALLDHGGDDEYNAPTPGSDPSSATLGYGILWDTQGNDHYQGTQHAQASALFGAALLIDAGGNNRFEANSHAQSHAIGGLALLVGGNGVDQYSAQADAQASAGPFGVAVLLDSAGDDRYVLNNVPLLRPSPQLPTHNASMGQGAGRGIRASALDGRSTAGGIGMLMDLAGNDHYTAQVFAQGVGYFEGLGLLVDDGGDDTFDAAWYAMGAGAHSAAGVLLKRGAGHDHYHISHTLSLGAAHDFSVGVFLDEGGNDHYDALDLALGVAHDNSAGLFVDVAGDDSYLLANQACRAFGSAIVSEWGKLRESLPNTGLFFDLGGQDHYPSSCKPVQNDSSWRASRLWPLLKLPSEAGGGWDGLAASPFATRPLTTKLPTPYTN
jgi:hypothetical protein